MKNQKHTAHTPGPWQVVENCVVAGSTDDDMHMVASIPIGAHFPARFETETGQQNARLIAAAPEMLEALEETLKYLDDSGDLYPIVMKALKKARGE